MFEQGKIYRRRDLHKDYGGGWQGGISPSATHKVISLFTGETGVQYGYNDGWGADGTFRYTGEGQVGDMAFRRGNKAIRDHAQHGKELHLFERAGVGHVRYVGQMEYLTHEIVSRVHDREKSLRIAIVFRLIPIDRDHRKSGI